MAAPYHPASLAPRAKLRSFWRAAWQKFLQTMWAGRPVGLGQGVSRIRSQCGATEEPVLADDYPVYLAYSYLVDGKAVRSPGTGTVADVKRVLRAAEVRRCDIAARGLHASFEVVEGPIPGRAPQS
jgi:hypothetical protein